MGKQLETFIWYFVKTHKSAVETSQAIFMCSFTQLLLTMFSSPQRKITLTTGNESLVAQMVKPAMQQPRVQFWFGKITQRTVWQPIPVFLPGEFHGQKRLAGYSPWGRKESDTTEQLTHTHTATILRLILRTRHLQTHHLLNPQNCLREVGRQIAPQKSSAPSNL